MAELQLSPNAAHALRWFTAGLTRARRWTTADGRMLEITKQNHVVYFVRWEKVGYFPQTGFVERCGSGWMSEEAVVLESALTEAISALGLDDVARSDNLAHIVERIDAFDARCAETEYTDTGDAWELLRWIREVL